MNRWLRTGTVLLVSAANMSLPIAASNSPAALNPAVDYCAGHSEQVMVTVDLRAQSSGESVQRVCWSMDAQSRFGDLVGQLRNDPHAGFVHSIFDDENPERSTITVKYPLKQPVDQHEFQIVVREDLPTLGN